jgi:HEAT repeat protein
VAALLAGFAVMTYGQDEPEVITARDRDASIQTLLTRVCSENATERYAAAFALGEGRIGEAVVPLLKMLHNGTEQCRIVAALSLCRLGDERGIYAVRQSALMDESPKVRALSAFYYNEYVKEGTFAFVLTPKSTPTEIATK